MAEFIFTPTVSTNVEEIALAMRHRRGILVRGPLGCGKTAMIQHLARQAKASATMIQIAVDDAFDSKDLIGKFSVGATPGDFVWMAGPLSIAAAEGRWILIEDIDLASRDVCTALMQLLDKGCLYIAEKDTTIVAHPNFRLIGTQQLVEMKYHLSSNSVMLTRKGYTIPHVELWGSVVVLPPTVDELEMIVLQLHSRVSSLVVRQLFRTVHCARELGAQFSLHDVLKWASRVEAFSPLPSASSTFLSSTMREAMLREALDVFCGRISKTRPNVSAVLEELTTAFGVPIAVTKSLLYQHKPNLVVAERTVTVGRVQLSRNFVSNALPFGIASIFAPTKIALNLLEDIAAAVYMKEPVLLTGETGVGKTFLVQHLAGLLNQQIVVHNVSHQTDSADFMGGWRPTDCARHIVRIAKCYVEIFLRTFDAGRNAEHISALNAAVRKRSWQTVLKAIDTGVARAMKTLDRRVQFGQLPLDDLRRDWIQLGATVAGALDSLQNSNNAALFHFEEGTLVRAWKDGLWILFDEINLASSEVLERIASVLGNNEFLFLAERGDTKPVQRHPNFRVFANMNPPTDVGKKDLPPSLKSRFTEYFVDEPASEQDLAIVIAEYVGQLVPVPPVAGVAKFYLHCREASRTLLCDPSADLRMPHYSLRTLTRSLSYARHAAPLYGFKAALYDGLMMCFATPLCRRFHDAVESFLMSDVFDTHHGSILLTLPLKPSSSDELVAFEHLWLEAGSFTINVDETYVLTDSVKRHLKNIARAVASKCPVLLEGPTSSGKSSMVRYLAQRTGHKFVRINNHENTDIQEYLGQYISDENGRLRFVDGALVEAVRFGHWVVLDELNLAPSEVLEALNRLLDENAELFVPDTQEVIKAHPHLRIFATQNPAGVYGGRKLLSRAFRNRFLEVTVDDIPISELKEILCSSYQMPPSFAEKMVSVMSQLQLRRQSTLLFSGRHGFITPRDLFRWAERGADTYEDLAAHALFLLGDRCRRNEDRQVVKDVLEATFHVELNEEIIYDPQRWECLRPYFSLLQNAKSDISREFALVWTSSLRRLFTITGLCLHFHESVLLVGETGSSKTTICQLWARLLGIRIHILNCHQHTEAADFIGALRPNSLEARVKCLFSWSDGPLVRCMKNGSMFVMDEISLADDSVLERINSVLEPSRQITLVEKSSGDFLTAREGFCFMATMNQGGDFGKRELSPALRNRFVEVFVRPVTNEGEVAQIVAGRLDRCLHHLATSCAKTMLFIIDLHRTRRHNVSIRDACVLAHFLNCCQGVCDPEAAFVHGVDAVMLEGSAVGVGDSDVFANAARKKTLTYIQSFVSCDVEAILQTPFWNLCSHMRHPKVSTPLYSFDAATTIGNLSKIMRATVLPKPVLLEGSPGVGKTSLVEALGAALRISVVRINLSDHTDMMDLLGTFLPCSGSEAGPRFEWSDGILLRAVKDGHWVILDELNLAQQTVLEGLNALLDHRSSLYIPELCCEVPASPGFRLFGCQNPLAEGGGRKGLPRSFLNRFSRVRIDPFNTEDLHIIAEALSKDLVSRGDAELIVDFVSALHREVVLNRNFGVRGAPWEFNLRDVVRWAMFSRKYGAHALTDSFLWTLFYGRFRSLSDRYEAEKLFSRLTSPSTTPARKAFSKILSFTLSENCIYADGTLVGQRISDCPLESDLLLLPSQSQALRAILQCVHVGQFAIIVGPTSSGKTSLLNLAAALMGKKLLSIMLTSGSDTTDLLGGFAQKAGKPGNFDWKDSLLLHAMENGEWVVLENANFCSPTVLDRLNSIVEPGGVLVVNEQGLVGGETRVIKPHEHFRLFLTMDPRYGEVSRAMRNRAIEIFVDQIDVLSVDAIAVAQFHFARCVPNSRVTALCFAHSRVLEIVYKILRGDDGRLNDAVASGAPSLRTLVNAAEMLGMLPEEPESFGQVVRHYYVRNSVGPLSKCLDVSHVCTQPAPTVASLLCTAGQADRHLLLWESDVLCSTKLAAVGEVQLIQLRIQRCMLYLRALLRSSVPLKEAAAALVHFLFHLFVLVPTASCLARIFDQCVQHLEEMSNDSQTCNEILLRARNDIWALTSPRELLSFWPIVLCSISPLKVPSTSVLSHLMCCMQNVVTSRELNPRDALLLRMWLTMLVETEADEFTYRTAVTVSAALTVIRSQMGSMACTHGNLREAENAIDAVEREIRKCLRLSPTTPLHQISTLWRNLASPVATIVLRETIQVSTKTASSESVIHPLWLQVVNMREHLLLSRLSSMSNENATEALQQAESFVSLASSFLVFASTDLTPYQQLCSSLRMGLSLNDTVRKHFPSIIAPFLLHDSVELLTAFTNISWFPCTVSAIDRAAKLRVRDLSPNESVPRKVADSVELFLSKHFCAISIVSCWRPVMLRFLVVTLAVYSSSAPNINYNEIERVLMEIAHSSGNEDLLLSAVDLLVELSSGNSELSCHKALLVELQNALRMMHELSDREELVFSICLVLFAALQCRLLCPQGPVDPVFRRRLKLAALEVEARNWNLFMSDMQASDLFTRCGEESVPTSFAASFQSEVVQRLEKTREKASIRPDNSGVQFFHLSEQLRGICEVQLSDDKLCHLTTGIIETQQQSPMKKRRKDSPDVTVEELASCAVVARHAAEELITGFRGYEDFVTLFASNLLIVSFGARAASTFLEARCRRQLQAWSREQFMSLVCFPVASFPLHFPRELDASNSIGLLNYMDSAVQFVGEHHGWCYWHRGVVDELFHSYRELVGAALINRATSLEPPGTVSVKVVSAEQQVVQSQALLPSYVEFFVGEDENFECDAHMPKSSDVLNVKAAVLLKESTFRRIREMVRVHKEFYLYCFRRSKGNVAVVPQVFDPSAFVARFDAVTRLMDPSLLAPLDVHEAQRVASGAAVKATTTRQTVESLLASRASNDLVPRIQSAFNIYTDADPIEARSASSWIQKLLMHVSELAVEYPDNYVLQRIQKIGSRIDDLDAFSCPLMKLLTGLEILLRECFEWERNAASHVSLAKEIEGVSNLILRWRRLELRCWPYLFVAKDQRCESIASLRLLALWNDSCSEDSPGWLSLSSEIQRVLWESSIGEFAFLVGVLWGFGMERLVSGRTGSAQLILHLTAYFFQFVQVVMTAKEQALGQFREEMQAFADGMSWEDASYYAVRASAEKSHLQIRRWISSIEESLAGRVTEVVQKEEERCDEDEWMGLQRREDIETNAPKFSKRKARESTSVVEPKNPPCSAFSCDVICSTIDFLEQLATKVASEVGLLQQAGTSQNQKQRALKMLLEVTHEAGIPQSKEASSPSWEDLLAALPFVGDSAGPSENSFYKSIRHLQRLREFAEKTHSDISVAHARRGVAMCESLFSVATRQIRLMNALSSAISSSKYARKCIAVCDEHAAVSYSAALVRSASSTTELVASLNSQLKWASSTMSALKDRGEIVKSIRELEDVVLLLRTSIDSGPTEALTCNFSIPSEIVTSLLLNFKKAESLLVEILFLLSATTFVPPVECALREVRSFVNGITAVSPSSEQSSMRERLIVTQLQRLEEVFDFSGDVAMNAGENNFALGVDASEKLASAIVSAGNFSTILESNGMRFVSGKSSILKRLDCILEKMNEFSFLLQRLHSATCNACHVLSRLFSVLCKRGFCKTEDNEAEEEEQDGTGTHEGTGMDKGKGNKDVTNELENEDQLLKKDDLHEEDEESHSDDGDAADAEANIAGRPEKRNEKDEEEAESGDEVERGSSADDGEPERKKSRKDDTKDMERDDGEDQPSEVAGEEFERSPSLHSDEEHEDAENKEDAVKAQKNADAKDDELAANSLDFDNMEEASERDDDKTDPLSNAQESDHEQEEDDDNGQEEAENAADKQESKSASEEISEHGSNKEDSSCGDDAKSSSVIDFDKDENPLDGGLEDEEIGEETTENKIDISSKQNANANQEIPQGNQEQSVAEGGQVWKPMQSRVKSGKRDVQQVSKPSTQSREALQQFRRSLKQLQLDKRVDENDALGGEDGTASDLSSEDYFKMDEKAPQSGLAPAAALPTVSDAQDLQKKGGSEERDNNSENDEDAETREKTQPAEERTETRAPQKKRAVLKLQEEPMIEEMPDGNVQASVDPFADHHKLWLDAEAATSSLSQQLCEQLRLILEPTVADRLQGDYKTGKRINIKKIIPYIASQFKKDRIWLRRTKASKRTYQVLVGIDDSLSMRHYNAGFMSCQALTLICKALQQLEVGEIGILAFGAKTSLVHPLDRPFTATSGPEAFSHISFLQQSTDIKLFLQIALDYMDIERERSSSHTRSTMLQLMQILFVVTDGHITEDRAQLRKLVARAESNKQVVVLLILDANVEQPPEKEPPRLPTPAAGGHTSAAVRMRQLKAEREERLQRVQRKSVMDMQIVEFKGTEVLKRRYFEDFPFAFFLVVRDLHTLPEVLADAMRQWFELTSQV